MFLFILRVIEIGIERVYCSNFQGSFFLAQWHPKYWLQKVRGPKNYKGQSGRLIQPLQGRSPQSEHRPHGSKWPTHSLNVADGQSEVTFQFVLVCGWRRGQFVLRAMNGQKPSKWTMASKRLGRVRLQGKGVCGQGIRIPLHLTRKGYEGWGSFR